METIFDLAGFGAYGNVRAEAVPAYLVVRPPMTKKKSEKSAAIVLAAGLGTRMKSALPKVMHPVAGRPMIQHLLASLEAAGFERTIVVVSPDANGVAEAVVPHEAVVQKNQLGTGDAVKAALPALDGFDGEVLVLFGADPLVRPETITRMIERRRAEDDPAVVVLGFRPNDPAAYGRLVTDADGRLTAIVEAKDATPEQLRIGLCNSGIMAIDGKRLGGLIGRIGNDNAKAEFYLTDIIALAVTDGDICAFIEGDAEELIGVDDRADLARAEAALQNRLRAEALAGGTTLIDPDTVYLSFDTRLGRDTVVGPQVFFGPGVRVGDGVEINAFSHIEGADIADGAVIGPFARLRPGTRIETNARVGNFVETKNLTLGEGAKANHLTYLGDSTIGAKANIGAGTITCNYDGFNKSRTEIGAGAFIGSNTALVAPVSIGDGAIVGAGSTIAKDVEADALAVTRAPQDQRAGWAAKFRILAARKKKG